MSTPQVVALLAFAGVAIGSFLAWARVGIFSVSGTAGDGTITLIGAVVGGAMVAVAKSRWPIVVAALIGFGCAAVGIYDAINIAEIAGENDSIFTASVGEGLYLVIIAGVVAGLATARIPEAATTDRPGKHCPKCGAAVGDRMEFCASCGTALDIPARRRYGRLR
ncbi:MAG TPA: zinc ribbon domain-containing protein [Dehalococcoidia bacterium]|nr:zinc ribbon domain-containing protein [Dehalococcoidia bacterium]